MAQLNSRGTQTRNRWDFFEQSNGWAFVFGQVASGGIGCYFGNNSTGSTALDIYNITWAATVGIPWDVWVIQPDFAAVSLAPLESSIVSLEPTRARLPGVVGMYTASTGTSHHIMRITNDVNGGSIAPIANSFFLTLPPGWSIAVSGNPGAAACELSMSIWYQEVLDNIMPAQ